MVLFDDVPLLMKHAAEDPSIAIRLIAADVVSDILSRRRLHNPSDEKKIRICRSLCSHISPRKIIHLL